MDHTILLAEYSEAGQQCRWYEQLSRTSLVVFSALATAALSYQAGSSATPTGNLIVSVFGVLVSIVLFGSTLRNSDYYRAYMKRLHELENEAGMGLYLGGLDAHRGMRFPSDKITFSVIYASGAVAFVLSGIRAVIAIAV